MREIQARAREAHEELVARADGLAEEERLDEAIALLGSNLERFRGTRHAFAIREKMETYELGRRTEEAAPEEAKETVVRRHEFLRQAEDAEGLAQRRKYAAAAAGFEKAALDCPFRQGLEFSGLDGSPSTQPDAGTQGRRSRLIVNLQNRA